MLRILIWATSKIGVLGLLLVFSFLVYAAQYWLADELARRRDALPDPAQLRVDATLQRADADHLHARMLAVGASRELVEDRLREVGERAAALQRDMGETREQVQSTLARTGHLREQAEQRSRYTRELWERRIQEACNDAAWYRFVENAARRRACESARAGRDTALRQLDAWREAQQARVEEARDEAARLEQLYRDQFESFARTQPQASELRAELLRIEEAGAELRTRKDELLAWATDLDGRADEAVRAREQIERYMMERWRESWRTLVLILLALQMTPYLVRALNYWVLMRFVQREQPLRLLPRDAPGTLKAFEAERTTTVQVGPEQTLWARSSAVRPLSTGVARTRVLYRWRQPLVSLAANLFLLTEVRGRATAEGGVSVTLSPSGADAADRYVIRVDLDDHPGLVVHPRHVVAVLGDLRVASRFRLRSTHAWATGKLRYISLAGTGSVFLEGVGDVRAESLEGASRHEAAWSVIGFDARLDYRAWRTELFLPYLLHGQRLVEVQLAGEGVFLWQKCEFTSARRPGEWLLGSFWSALGRLLGF